MNLSIPTEHTTPPVHPKSHAAGFTTPTETRYKPGSVVIMGSHCRAERETGAAGTQHRDSGRQQVTAHPSPPAPRRVSSGA